MTPTPNHAADYIQSLRSRNYAQTTTYSRNRAIVRFRNVMQMDPLEANQDQMVGWWTQLAVTPSSRASELAAIRGYCRWAVRHGIIQTDPTCLLDRPRIPRRVPRPLAEDLLFEALGDAKLDVQLILGLAAFCGLRACEISALEWPDVRPDKLILQGKGAKERVVPMHPFVKTALNRLPGARRGAVLKRRDGKAGRVPPHLICQWANNYLHSIGIGETLHQARHRFGSLVYQLSRDLRLTQDLLGHSSPVTTAGYAAWNVESAAGVIAQLPTSA